MIICITFYVQQNHSIKIESEFKKVNIDNSYDILKPKFTINNNKQKIAVTANEGNFLNNDKILLQNNVLFESNNFKIYSDKVLFDKKNQTATSQEKSTFISNGTKIDSEGFNITEQGTIINFNGKTKLILNK